MAVEATANMSCERPFRTPTAGFQSTVLAVVKEVYFAMRARTNTYRQIAAFRAIEDLLAETEDQQTCRDRSKAILKQFEMHNASMKKKKL